MAGRRIVHVLDPGVAVTTVVTAGTPGATVAGTVTAIDVASAMTAVGVCGAAGSTETPIFQLNGLPNWSVTEITE